MLQVLKYPNPILRRGGKPVSSFDAELARIADQMFEAMYEFDGVGLAAPQVGLELRLLVLNPSGDKKQHDQALALCNPRVLSKKQPEWGEEGCLSFPGIYAELERPRDIVVAFQDLTGAAREQAFTGFLSRIIQHEIDHLDGILFIDRMTAADKLRVRPKLIDLETRYKAG
jgi:peptide deformylase